MLHHISTHLDFWFGESESKSFMFVLLKQFYSLSWIFVGMFFFVSGYGMKVQMLKTKGSYIDTFLSKRFMKILPPFVVISIIALILTYIMYPSYDIVNGFIGYVTHGEVFFTGWFIPVLILFYMLFYISFRYTNRIIHGIILLCFLVFVLDLYFVVNKFGGYWYCSNLCFPMGVIYAYHEKTISRMFISRPLILFLGLSLVVIVVCCSIILSYNMRYLSIVLPYPIIIIIVFFSYLNPINVINRFFVFLSDISYELFLVHIVLLSVADRYIYKNTMPMVLFVFMFLSISMLVSWGFHKVFNLTVKR